MAFSASRLAARLGSTVLGATALTLLALSGASAQYYQPDYYRGPPPGYYGGPPPGYYGDGYARPRRMRMGSVCVTSRGACQQPNYSPVGGRCFCIIPGFGKKHGMTQE